MIGHASLSVAATPHPFSIALGTTALLVIDMQHDFCHPDGFCGHNLGVDLSAVTAIVPRIQTVVEWCRHHDILVVYTRESHRADLSDVSPSKQLRYTNAGYPVGTLGNMGRFLVQGEAGTALLDAFHPLPTERTIDKPAQSAFVATDLEAQLRDRGITHLLLTGVTTECCVLGTYRHASDLGFYCLLLEDCCAAFSDTEHQAAIAVILGENGAIGWVTTSDTLLALKEGRSL
ncbi:cysteine hydrolase [Phormidium sp. FACHB-592]|uniref:Cysteine hydrolase n=1 Tax=Stenomitos frigidus AS-A4 TaxID=2933935 RepID=A0ABV0KJ06_9CYAN|nr:isochorismatase family cysteine hydrolase [Phormidium sp. FACHB-592]MBD2074752.1 cysteine hydrolase [Phormidium sp. FACHB-592]